MAERTLRRWPTEPVFLDAVFRDAVSRARREAFGQAIWLTQRYAAVAVATLVKIMNDAAAPPPSKVSAAATLLRFGREGIVLDDLAERVEALERSAKGDAASPSATYRNRRNGKNGNATPEPDRRDS